MYQAPKFLPCDPYISTSYAVVRVSNGLSYWEWVSVTFVYSMYCIKTSKQYPQTFSSSGWPTILVFIYQALWQRGRRMQVGCEKIPDFRSISRFISKMIEARAIVTTERQHRMVPFSMNLSELGWLSEIFNDIARPLCDSWGHCFI